MRLSITFLLLLLLTLTCSSALKCYFELSGMRERTACHPLKTNCLLYSSKTGVFRICATDSFCDYYRNKAEGDGGTALCCQTDYCNQ
ncbi:hypothetical protein XENTR_v10023420 [Xenopus tropicalis]|nr:hypothetical protein XENTR_v10023420 [Xenopus tropicalis]